MRRAPSVWQHQHLLQHRCAIAKALLLVRSVLGINQICCRYHPDLLEIPAAQAGAAQVILTLHLAVQPPALHGQRAHAHYIIKGKFILSTTFLGPTVPSPPSFPDGRAQQSRCSPVFPTLHFYTCTCCANLL